MNFLTTTAAAGGMGSTVVMMVLDMLAPAVAAVRKLIIGGKLLRF